MIDLHMHSRFSDDGEFTPLELIDQCAAKKIEMMSITDHNCVQANYEAQAAAKAKGITYITGTEIDCIYKDTNFHVLGYGIDFKSDDFKRIEQNIKEQSLRVSLDNLAKTQELGFHITADEMWAMSKDSYWQEMWNGEMFAEVLLAKPEYNDHPLLLPYRPGGLRSDNPFVNFYWDYYSQGKPCHVFVDYPPMEQIIEMIHRNHGVAILAHPGVNLKGKEHLLDGILDLGMDGIETYCSYHSAEQAEYFYQKALGRQLLTTCGSDYHGKTKPFVQLGGMTFLPEMDSEEECERIGKALLDII